MYITGRIKGKRWMYIKPVYVVYVVCIELIILASGETINPLPIEDCIKSKVFFLSNMMVLGDGREYLTCLMTLKVCIVRNP